MKTKPYITPIADAPIGVPCQVEGVVQHQEVQFKPRKQLIVQIKDASGSALHLRFIDFYLKPSKAACPRANASRAAGEIKHGFYGDEITHPKSSDAEGSGLAESPPPFTPR